MRVVQQHSHQEDKVNLKADRLKIVKSETKETLDKIPNQERSKILVCNKPNCWKRGGKAVCELLKESLRDRGWEEKVEIRETGCFKECKNAPVIVMLPNKARYKQVQPQQIPSLIEKHLAV
jgi:NADH:ubiquinone oxidoreductase subunit E